MRITRKNAALGREVRFDVLCQAAWRCLDASFKYRAEQQSSGGCGRAQNNEAQNESMKVLAEC